MKTRLTKSTELTKRSDLLSKENKMVIEMLADFIFEMFKTKQVNSFNKQNEK